MIPIKIECGCGQHYAFDVEPEAGRLPYPVNCPACGADGTTAAEVIIAQSQPAPVKAKPAVRIVLKAKEGEAAPAPAAAASLKVPVAVAAHAAQPTRRPTGLPEPDRDRALAEARSKICWGDSYEEVVKFVMMQGILRDEAIAIVSELRNERLKMLREAGIRKIVTGGAMICLPIGSWIGFNQVGFISFKLFGLTVAVGLYGAYILSKGCFMLVAPESESGDVADK